MVYVNSTCTNLTILKFLHSRKISFFSVLLLINHVINHLIIHVICGIVKSTMKITSISENTVSINDLRRNFGEIEKALPFVSYFVITKKGKPFATLSATLVVKKELMKKTAGVFKGSKLNSDVLWKEVSKKKSRKQSIRL